MIAQAIVDAAVTFAAPLADSPGVRERQFVAGAYYDVRQKRASFAAILHANEAGDFVTLPFEAPGAWGSEISTPR